MISEGGFFFVANCHMATSQLVFLILGGIWWKCGGFRNSRTPQTKSTSCVKFMMYYLFVFWRVSNLGYHLFWITPMISCSYSCKDLMCDPFDVTCYDLCETKPTFSIPKRGPICSLKSRVPLQFFQRYGAGDLPHPGSLMYNRMPQVTLITTTLPMCKANPSSQ